MKLSLKSRLLALKKELLVGSKVVHTRLGEHRRDFRNGKHLVTQTGKMLDHLDERRGLASARTTRKYYFLDIVHLLLIIIMTDEVSPQTGKTFRIGLQS